MSLYANRAKTLVIVGWVLVVLLFVELLTGLLLGCVFYEYLRSRQLVVIVNVTDLLPVFRDSLIVCGVVGFVYAMLELFQILKLTKAVRLRDARHLHIWLAIRIAFFFPQILVAGGCVVAVLLKYPCGGAFGVFLFWTLMWTIYNGITIKIVYDLRREIGCGGGRSISVKT